MTQTFCKQIVGIYDRCKHIADMIKSFRNKQLANLWSGKRSKIDGQLYQRILIRLDRLDAATKAEEMNLPGYNFHHLSGFNPTRYIVHVNGPWCITFEFSDGDVHDVNFEQYR